MSNKQVDGNLTIEFQPDEIGPHEFRIFPDATNRKNYQSFNLNVYDSSLLKLEIASETVIGKTFLFTGKCEICYSAIIM